MMMSQVVMVSLEELVPENHIYRKFQRFWDFQSVENPSRNIETDNNYKGYGILRLFKCLLFQFMKDLSDRELERFIQENTLQNGFAILN